MPSSEIDLLALLHTNSMEADTLCQKARRVRQRAQRLSVAEQSQMPPFLGAWSKDSLLSHLERLEEWIRDPVRAQNRGKYEGAGINAGRCPSEFLDDSEQVDEIVQSVTAIAASQPILLVYLNLDESFLAWSREGPAIVKKNVETIHDNLHRYGRLLTMNCSEAVKEQLVRLAVFRPDTLSDTELLAKQLEDASDAGIQIPNAADLRLLRDELQAVSQSLDTLRTSFPEKIDDLRAILRGRLLGEAKSLLAVEVGKYTTLRSQLQEERASLRNALAILGHPVGSAEPARTLGGLRQEVERYKQECVSTVGEHSLSLLDFFQGKGRFPNNLTLDEVEKALTPLCPLVVMALKYGGPNA
jgi:hypothetical protein